jgi:hypothetical protein
MALSGSGVTCLPVERQIAVCAANLPEHHRDTADRYSLFPSFGGFYFEEALFCGGEALTW